MMSLHNNYDVINCNYDTVTQLVGCFGGSEKKGAVHLGLFLLGPPGIMKTLYRHWCKV